jgi:hypothetical protein
VIAANEDTGQVFCDKRGDRNVVRFFRVFGCEHITFADVKLHDLTVVSCCFHELDRGGYVFVHGGVRATRSSPPGAYGAFRPVAKPFFSGGGSTRISRFNFGPVEGGTPLRFNQDMRHTLAHRQRRIFVSMRWKASHRPAV